MARNETAATRRALASGRKGSLDEAFAATRTPLMIAGLFSLGVNLLMLAQPLFMLQVYDRVITTGHYETLLVLFLIAVFAVAIMALLDSIRSTLLSRVGHWFNERLGDDLMDLSITQRLHGDTMGAQLLRDAAQIRSFLSGPALATAFDAPWVPLFIAIIWLLHPWLGATALAAAVTLLALAVINERATRAKLEEAARMQILSNIFAEGAIRNAEAVHAMAMNPMVTAKWRQLHGVEVESSGGAAELSGHILGLIKFVRFGVQIGILALGAYLVLQGKLTPGGMIAGSILLGRALGPVEQATGSWRAFSSARIARGRLEARFANQPKRVERMQLPEPAGRLEVEGVSYKAAGVERPILDRVSFVLEPGEALAVVGPSAAGKSSLCRMLVGVIPPSEGLVRLDGADMRVWDRAQLGRWIGFLPQGVELFNGSVKSNIARLIESPNDEEVIEAAQLAGAHDMIVRLPHGYDTQIGDAGMKLSAGQRQRVGLARALFRRPKLVVLDEPNANLDRAGEAALADAVNELRALGTTTVLVGHRPSTLRNVDKIMVMKAGRIELLGPRDEVLRKLQAASQQEAAGAPARPAAAADAPPPAAGPAAAGRETTPVG
jgi:ATP-binding cassette subfamily C protein/ATP-binding cassette subfamily C exporter for protease/lipase/ATP-binding cassette subfamily C protein EexD